MLGKYRADETQINVISVGTNVRLRGENGSVKDYLLLRVILIESIRKIWIFPVEYQNAEIGVITKSGDYVIDSTGMRSRSFLDFIREYNFEDDYNKLLLMLLDGLYILQMNRELRDALKLAERANEAKSGWMNSTAKDT